jgi:hypothetical protein
MSKSDIKYDRHRRVKLNRTLVLFQQYLTATLNVGWLLIGQPQLLVSTFNVDQLTTAYQTRTQLLHA